MLLSGRARHIFVERTPPCLGSEKNFWMRTAGFRFQPKKGWEIREFGGHNPLRFCRRYFEFISC